MKVTSQTIYTASELVLIKESNSLLKECATQTHVWKPGDHSLHLRADTSVGLGLCVDSHRSRLLVLSKGYFRNPLWRQSTHSSLTTLVAL
ncbi:hypothetical protein YC2023_043025 [Brassica napus]